MSMDKFAVVTDDVNNDKQAELDKRCPVCGSLLDSRSNVPKCPIHGTKPFEKDK